MPLNTLINKAKESAKIDTDKELADFLGYSHGVIHHWRKTGRAPHERIAQLAEMAGEDPEIWVLRTLAENTESRRLRRALNRILERVTKLL